MLLISPELGQYHPISCVLSEDHYQMAANWSNIRSGEAMGTRNSMAGFGSKLGTLGLWQLDKQRILYSTISMYVKTECSQFQPRHILVSLWIFGRSSLSHSPMKFPERWTTTSSLRDPKQQTLPFQNFRSLTDKLKVYTKHCVGSGFQTYWHLNLAVSNRKFHMWQWVQLLVPGEH